MTPVHSPRSRLLAAVAAAALGCGVLAGCSGDASESAPSGASSATGTVPVLQPGKPGEPNKTVTNPRPAKSSPVNKADVTFMQDMIIHHSQAVTMVEIVDGKLTDSQVEKLATRIGKEQKPEMKYMSRWLRNHDQKVPSTDPGQQDEGGHGGHEGMPGMATPADLSQLRRATGVEKDLKFLSLMRKHHQGALMMVDDLIDAGGGTDPDISKFSGDVYAVQSAQIRSMEKMRDRLKTDTTESAPAPPTT